MVLTGGGTALSIGVFVERRILDTLRDPVRTRELVVLVARSDVSAVNVGDTLTIAPRKGGTAETWRVNEVMQDLTDSDVWALRLR